jgi:hypothetical protein
MMEAMEGLDKQMIGTLMRDNFAPAMINAIQEAFPNV